MSTKDDILSRLNALMDKADKVMATHKPNPPGVIGFPTLASDAFAEWQTQSLAYLTTVLGHDHIYVRNFADRVKRGYTGTVAAGKGILKAVREDIDGGYLKKVEDLVSADIFSDFLEMAVYLLQEGYKDPAASLGGAVLEDGLRRVATNKGIKFKTREDLNSLNQKLGAAGVYSRLTQKKVQVWIDVRNNADHGHFSGYEKSDVEDMLKGVQDLLEQFL